MSHCNSSCEYGNVDMCITEKLSYRDMRVNIIVVGRLLQLCLVHNRRWLSFDCSNLRRDVRTAQLISIAPHSGKRRTKSGAHDASGSNQLIRVQVKEGAARKEPHCHERHDDSCHARAECRKQNGSTSCKVQALVSSSLLFLWCGPVGITARILAALSHCATLPMTWSRWANRCFLHHVSKWRRVTLYRVRHIEASDITHVFLERTQGPILSRTHPR